MWCSYFNGDSDGEQDDDVGSEALLQQQLAEELQGDTVGGVSEDEDDPLDAFMAGIQVWKVHVWSVIILLMSVQTQVERQSKTPAPAKKQYVA